MALEGITNRHSWPEEVIRVITKDRYTDPTEEKSDYSVTRLINPIQQTILLQRYPDKKKTQDVSDLFWSFLGHMAHAIIEEEWKEAEGVKSEERLYLEIEGMTISGKVDCYANGQLKDYKTTKVYKVQRGDYTEWAIQLNLYKLLLEHAGYPVESMKIIAILFDWKKQEVFKADYPSSQIVEIPIKGWEKEKAYQYLTSRIKALQRAATLSDEDIWKEFPCSDKECWSDVKDFSVIKKGATRATRCCPTYEDALVARAALGNPTDYDVVERRTERKRCLEHCLAAPSCLQLKQYLAERESK